MIDPEDLAAFHAAVADAKPLPPVDRAEIARPKKPPLPRPRSHEPETRTPAKPTLADTLPAHWHAHREGNVPPRPTDPDQLAFLQAIAGVEPLPERNLVVHGNRPPPPKPLQHIADERAALHESLHGHIGLQDRLEGGDEPHYLRHGLANTVLRDLRRGRWVLQGELDLHGLNREEARHQLAAFLAASLHAGKRCVRVIHGKGHGSPQKLSILRQLVRGWLAQRIEVLAYCQAKPADGGEGALIVLLRNQK